MIQQCKYRQISKIPARSTNSTKAANLGTEVCVRVVWLGINMCAIVKTGGPRNIKRVRMSNEMRRSDMYRGELNEY